MLEYYLFFDKDGMPLAVFYTACKGDAFDLFARLYRRDWSESVKLGITIEKEKDVPAERWDEIYSRRVVTKTTPPVVPNHVVNLGEYKRMDSTGLHSEKYMSRM